MGLFGSKTIYFIDSENVNDNWIDTIPSIKKSDEVRVFYTEKSANVSCENISKIAGGDVNLNWIKCFTGQNALDFQLVTDLGYSVAKGARDKFVIVSNDKGYDAVVNYWTIKGMDVSRISVEMATKSKKTKAVKKVAVKKTANKSVAAKSGASKNTASATAKSAAVNSKVNKGATSGDKSGAAKVAASTSKQGAKTVTKSKQDNTTAKSKQDNVTPKQTAKALQDNAVAKQEKSLWKKTPANDEGYVEAVGRCVTVKDLSRYHMVLTNLMGQGKGTQYYHKIKDDKELKSKISKTYISNEGQRLDYLVRIFLTYNKKDFVDLQAIINVINNKKSKDLNGFYKSMTEAFKEEKGRDYYNIFKGIYSVLKAV